MNHENQIDIIDLIKKSYYFIKKYSKLIIVFLTIGISIGLIRYYIFFDFQTRLAITSEIINKQEIINTLSNLKLIIANKQSSNKIINEIKDIKINDTSSNFINIDIILKKDMDTEKITSFLKQYFNEQPYFKTKKQIFQNNATIIINFIEKQLTENEQNSNYTQLKIDKNNIIINNNIEQYITMLQKKQEYQNKLIFSNDLIYFINTNQTTKIKKISYIINYIILSFIISLIIAIIIELNNHLNKKSE